MPTSTGPDGIDVSGYGWTNQSTTFQSNLSLESYGAPNSDLFNQAPLYGYGAQSILIQDAIAVPSHASTAILTRVFVPTTFTCGHLDIGVHAGTTPSFVAAIWPSTALNGTATPLVWAASTASPATPSTCTLTWNGTSSPSSVVLTGGNFYYVYTYTTTASTTVGGSTMSDSNMANINLTSTTYDTVTCTAVATPGAASVIASPVVSASKIWVGLRA